MKKTNLIKINIVLLALFLIIFLPIKANAADTIIRCDTTDTDWMVMSEETADPTLDDISAVVQTMGIGVVSSFYTYSMSPENGEKCGANLIAGYQDRVTGDRIELDRSCILTDEEQRECETFSIAGPQPDATSGQTSRRYGSILGFANLVDKSTKEPIPVNMAYFINQNLQKVPIVKNTAFAQPVSTDYTGPLLGLIYNYWMISRNVAFALMAVIMMVVGILIITRKSLDSKTAITVQQAMPQILISMLLIYLSYPIGATGASLAYGLLNSGAAWALDLFRVTEASLPEVATINLFSFGEWLGNGIAGFVARWITPAVVGITGIIVLFKIVGVYLKMLISIIAAPLVFAIGSIPGQQNNTIKWFRQFAANIVTLPVTILSFEIVKAVSADVGVSPLTNSNAFGEYGGFLLGTFTIFISLIVAIVGMRIVGTIPDKINEAFGVGGGGGGKK